MRSIEIDTGTTTSTILIGEKLSQVSNYLPGSNVVIITDENVKKLYEKQFPDFPVISIGLGEKNKTFATIEHIFNQFVQAEVDRSTFILAIGGGIVCDVAGFAASVYMRGLRFGFVSTTLLSQVDASVGGKNGINFQGYKNMVGVFNQPEFVICDPEMLSTLKHEEFVAGFAEIVKAGAIKDIELFNYIKDNTTNALQQNQVVLEKMIYHSVLIKSQVVEADEREKGERRKLNLGHTFGHALEKLTGMLHGEAVSIGIVLAAKMSNNMGLIEKNDVDNIVKLLQKLGLPTETDQPLQSIFKAMKQDKKKEGGSIHLVLLNKIGEAVVKKLSYNELEEHLNDLR